MSESPFFFPAMTLTVVVGMAALAGFLAWLDNRGTLSRAAQWVADRPWVPALGLLALLMGFWLGVVLVPGVPA